MPPLEIPIIERIHDEPGQISAGVPVGQELQVCLFVGCHPEPDGFGSLLRLKGIGTVNQYIITITFASRELGVLV